MHGTNRRLLLLVSAAALLSGCEAVPGWPTAGPTGSAAAVRDGSGGSSWVVVAPGRPSSTASLRPFASPSASPTSALLPRTSAAPAATPTLTCADRSWRAGRINGLTVLPGPGTATVQWVDPGGEGLRSYRVSAISQLLRGGRQPEVAAQTVTPTRPCARLSATFRGLDRATPYTFSLDAVSSRNSGDGTHAATVARALVVYTT